LSKADRYELESGWIAMPADGRAEERLGVPVIITPSRDGWMASGHIARIVPHNGIDVGWLWLALATKHVQAQIASLVAGSVVDATYPEDLGDVILPPPIAIDTAAAETAWASFDDADLIGAHATNLVELLLPD
jgi:hypothetical protein